LPGLVVSYNAANQNSASIAITKGNPMTPDMSDDEAQSIYDKLAYDSEMDEAAMALAPGTSVIFPDGSSIRRHDTGWDYGEQDPVNQYEYADEPKNPVINGNEQAFRRLLGG